jgi:23S rRNA (uridine2552-2'-O)-methyltransferase
LEKKYSNKLSRVNRQHIKVKTAKRRSVSSTKWLSRQLNDPYYQLSKQEGYRSRAAYKLLEINQRFKLFKPGQRVIDLGAAPGGWSQIAYESISGSKSKGSIIAIDKLPMDPLEGVNILQKDFLDEDIYEVIKKTMGGKVDIVLSDMSPSTCGDEYTDHLRIIHLCEIAFEFSKKMLNSNGALIMKTFSGGSEGDLLSNIKKEFRYVKYFKPDSSRKESKEMYLIAQDYKGNKND